MLQGTNTHIPTTWEKSSSSKSDGKKEGTYVSSQGGYGVVKLDGSILIPFSPIFWDRFSADPGKRQFWLQPLHATFDLPRKC